MYCSFVAKLIKILVIIKHSLVAQMVKNLPAMQAGDLGSVPESGRSPG